MMKNIIIVGFSFIGADLATISGSLLINNKDPIQEQSTTLNAGLEEMILYKEAYILSDYKVDITDEVNHCPEPTQTLHRVESETNANLSIASCPV